MIGSLFAGISGLNVNSTAMTVIGDNIANVNTTGFKSSRSSFATIMSQSLEGADGNDIGRGVQFWGTTPLWSQGSIENTSNPTDMAINGRGFFTLQDDSDSNIYSRAGDFSFNRDGFLVNPDGLFVQGYQVSAVNPDGTLVLGMIMDINVPGSSTTPPSQTNEFTVDVNLDAGAAVGETYLTTMIVYDSLGNAVPITISFEKMAVNQWDATASVPAGTLQTGPPAGTITISDNSFTFLGDGSLQNAPVGDPQIQITGLASGADPMNIDWDVFDDTTLATNGDLSQYAGPSVTTFQTQNGYPAGALRGVSVDEYGVVSGSYSNGQISPLYQVALADFPNQSGLSKMGKNLYAESRNSGGALFGMAQSGRLGSISPSAIEMSNVDLAQEFVKMITTQRAFQANSRVITTSDEILAELINLKR
jgi:flagellar hook protein FlgE